MAPKRRGPVGGRSRRLLDNLRSSLEQTASLNPRRRSRETTDPSTDEERPPSVQTAQRTLQGPDLSPVSLRPQLPLGMPSDRRYSKSASYLLNPPRLQQDSSSGPSSRDSTNLTTTRSRNKPRLTLSPNPEGGEGQRVRDIPLRTSSQGSNTARKKARPMLRFIQKSRMVGRLAALPRKKNGASDKDENSQFKHRGRFRKIGRFVVQARRILSLHAMKLTELVRDYDSVHLLLTDLAEDHKDLLFDPSDYKAVKEAPIGAELHKLLVKLPGTRTEEELYHIQVALRNYRSVAGLPVHMQRLFAERGWYQRHDSKHIITKEGQQPIYFYLVLSGSVISFVQDPESGINRAQGVLGRGDWFGDRAIRHRGPREITIISKQRVELLTMWAQDFADIFLPGALHDPNDPFLRGVRFLEGWPLKLLGETPRKAVYNFYRRGTVLTQDTVDSEWIYLIKSGSCDVMKKLTPENQNSTPTEPTPGQHKDKRLAVSLDSFLSHKEIVERHLADYMKIQGKRSKWLQALAMPEINIPLNTAPISVFTQRKIVPPIAKSSSSDVTRAEKSPDRQTTSAQKSVVSVKTSLSREDTAVSHTTATRGRDVRLTSSKPFFLKIGHSAEEDRDTDSECISTVESVNKAETTSPNVNAAASSLWKMVLAKTRTADKDTESDEVTSKETIEPEKPKTPKFVRVQVLTKGSMFGLADVMCGTQPIFSLISNGAEVITINKKFYLENCPPKLLARLRQEIYPFPSEAELERRYHHQMAWEKQKRGVIREVRHSMHLSRDHRNDACARVRVKLES